MYYMKLLASIYHNHCAQVWTLKDQNSLNLFTYINNLFLTFLNQSPAAQAKMLASDPWQLPFIHFQLLFIFKEVLYTVTKTLQLRVVFMEDVDLPDDFHKLLS